MEAKRSNTMQYQNNGHRVTTSSSKTQIMKKNASEISLTPSQAAEQAKLNGRKHPLDALSKLPNKQQTMERRSGLQDVDEEYLKQNIFRKPLFSRNSGLNEVNASQNQMTNVPAAGQHSIPPAEGSVPNPIISQAQLKVQQNYQEHAANMTPSHIQMQSQVHSAAGTMPSVQNNQQTINAKNQINHSSVSAQQDYQQQQQHQQQITQNQNTGILGNGQQNTTQPQTTIYNNTLTNQEPEMCTTCPNCQTTIYLVRGADVSHDMSPKVQNNEEHATPSGST